MTSKNTNGTTAVVIIIGIALVCVTGLLLAGRDITQVLYLLSSVLIPTFVLVVQGKKADERTEEVDKKLNVVKGLVNGNTTKMLAMLQANGVTTAELQERLKTAGWVDPEVDALDLGDVPPRHAESAILDEVPPTSGDSAR